MKFNINPDLEIPKYKQVLKVIEAGIMDGSLKKGTHLPSMSDIAFETGMSKETVKRALVTLRDKGYIASCPGKGYYVFDQNGKQVYSAKANTVVASTFKVGDKVKMKNGAPHYGQTVKFADWVYKSVLYVREIKGSRIVVSTQKTGAVTGAVDKKYLTKA